MEGYRSSDFSIQVFITKNKMLIKNELTKTILVQQELVVSRGGFGIEEEVKEGGSYW